MQTSNSDSGTVIGLEIGVTRLINLQGHLRLFNPITSKVCKISDQLLYNNYKSPNMLQVTLRSQAQRGEICSAFPYPIGPSLPQHLQEALAALIDTGAVTSSALASFAPRVQLSELSGQFANVNGGEIKILGQKKFTYITHQVAMNITFLIGKMSRILSLV